MNLRLVVHCQGAENCDAKTEIELDKTKLRDLPKSLRPAGWVVSVITPPGTAPVKAVLICGDCAHAVYGTKMMGVVKSVIEGN